MRSQSPRELSSRPSANSSWPSPEGSLRFSDRMEDGTPWPRISIVTPSLNQGQFIEETIQSVLGQNYPNLEYIVMDGGSSDNSVDIIRKYKDHLTYWESRSDCGQAHAINRGFSIAKGQIFGWLNSDDMYLPATLLYVAEQFQSLLRCFEGILFGNCIHLNETENLVWGSQVHIHHSSSDIELVDYLIQPSSFWTRTIWERVGSLSTEMRYGFDWDWFIRAKRKGVRFEACKRYLSVYRIHPRHKTATGGGDRLKEISDIYRKYHGENLAHTYDWLCKHNHRIKQIRRWFNKLRMTKILDLDNSIRTLFLRKVTKAQYDNIKKMV